MSLHAPVERLPGIGRSKSQKLHMLGIHTCRDLLEHFPRRYEDRSRVVAIADLEPGTWQLVEGFVQEVEERRPRKGMHLLVALIRDHSGWLRAVWFNQPFRKKLLPVGAVVRIYGKADVNYGRLQIVNGDLDLQDDSAEAILPVYSVTSGLQQKEMRHWVRSALETGMDELAETLPLDMRERLSLPSLRDAWHDIHFPQSWQALREARRRLIFEELLKLQLILAGRRESWNERRGIVHRQGDLCKRFLDELPFRLTRDQQSAWKEIEADMAAERPMHRLLQGDVGSGKTLLAALAMLRAVENDCQAALMAPTEVLAEQHFANLLPRIHPFGIRMALLRGGMSRKERDRLLGQIRSGEIQWVIGTHALLQEDVVWKRLSLVVADEQHRFGVNQRQMLLDKGIRAGEVPDMLVMTATPIPRTLALTLFGDLDVSIIQERPPGRQPIDTRVVSQEKRSQVYEFVLRELKRGRQAYIICARVQDEQPQDDGENQLDVRAATEVYEDLTQRLQPFKVGLLHGQMPTQDKSQVMRAFSEGKVQALVATTVIEVGIDVPNATVIVIEDADRYGLAQLHQLRGRVGRGSHPSYCILLAKPANEQAKQRLKAFRATDDGFAIAEADMHLRGIGEFFGSRQHGLPDFKIANPLRDQRLLILARREAKRLLEQDPRLEADQHQQLRESLNRFAPEQKLFVG